MFFAALFRNLKARRELFVALSSGVPALLLFVSCLAPTLTYGGDSGELIAAAEKLGIAHPTGYTLYLLGARTFSQLVPLGEIAWRYSLFSAVVSALAIAVIALTIFHVLSPPRVLARENRDASEEKKAQIVRSRETNIATFSSISAALLLAGFHPFWTQAVIAEVYALNALMLSLLLFAGVQWHRSADWRWFYALGALVGLSFNAHLSFVFLVPGLFLFVVWQHRKRFSISRFAVALGFFALAFSLTLYLPLRARLFPNPPAGFWWPLDWTHPANFANWRAHVSAAQYKHLLFAPHFPILAEPLSTLPQRLREFFTLVAVSYLWLSPLLLVGAFRAFSREKTIGASTRGVGFGAMLLCTALFNIGLEIHYQVSDRENFYFPAYLAMAIWMGIGLDALLRKLLPHADGASTRAARKAAPTIAAPPFSTPAQHAPVPKRFAPLQRFSIRFALLLLPLSIALQWILVRPFVSKRGEIGPRETALERARLAESFSARGQAPTVLLGGDDALWGFWYAQYALGRAPRAVTPWGKTVRETLQSPRAAHLVARLQPRGPVLLSFWNDAIDARFPYVLLSRGGELCLASQRVLPIPATQLFTATTSKFGDGWLLDARFRPRATHENSAPQLHFKRENLAVLEIDFALQSSAPLAPRIAKTPTRGDDAKHVAWLEVLTTPPDFPIPAPLQSDIASKTRSGPPVIAWKQTRRLVVPRTAVASTRWRAAFPLQMKTEAPTGNYAVWLRIVTSRRDAKTRWHRWGEITMSES